MKIKFFAVGGTIDKVYFDKRSEYQVGESMLNEVLKQANVSFDYECESLIHKDSLDMTDEDRQFLFDKIESDEHEYIVVTHGTDTMIKTAKKLQAIADKVVVLTGAMQPAKFKSSDAEFNIGCAVVAVQSLPPGIYIVMNGRIFKPERVRKNVQLNRFEDA
ncbi:MAG: asparaginase [Proteobacteria bacterium]|nr:asparaginase [Pseudomonadota bacterium]